MTRHRPHDEKDTRVQLPKVYLRIDPNLDQHPDAEGMLLLICAANRLPRRGRWDSREQIDRLLGRKRAATFLKPRRKGKRPDITELPDGTFYLVGWDEWQEGDLTVGERVRRLRERRNTAVTGPLHDPLEERYQTVSESLSQALPPPLPPSDALDVRRKTLTEERAVVEPALPETDNGALGKDAYFAEVWSVFRHVTGQERLAPSSQEGDVIMRWHQDRIPLRSVVTTLSETDSTRAHEVRSLAYFDPAVREHETKRRRLVGP